MLYYGMIPPSIREAKDGLIGDVDTFIEYIESGQAAIDYDNVVKDRRDCDTLVVERMIVNAEANPLTEDMAYVVT